MEFGPDTRVPNARCTNCGKLVDGAMCVGNNAVPEPGAITVCMPCGHVMAFDEGLALRELTDEEIVKVAGDPRLLAIQRARTRAKPGKSRVSED